MIPDLVLLHGWGMNAAVWSGVTEHLAKDYRLHLLELPGHGSMPFMGEETLEGWARACLNAAPEQAFWLGWSLGGQVATQAALLAPERIAGLLLTASAPRFVQGLDWPNAMPTGTLGQFAKALGQDYLGTIHRFLALQVRGSEQGMEVLRRLKRDLAVRPEADPAALTTGLRLLRETDLRHRIPALHCPIAFIFGERDALVPIRVADDLATLVPWASINRIAGSAHAPFLSHPAAWLRMARHSIDLWGCTNAAAAEMRRSGP
ncbi:MAG: pimeloyl-ACP methyl ester esterase BioH [Gammaproteobacteria bacterium]|nr:pimeloyl-ACP methyl ester esterase BioH [Gammaproteobacteria bacterium]MBU1654190.1 pimeloyl-ACP methyl ester esterase BioH [Gammaproteobacteria bacterium]MBU1959664.1 pimeloyl-ACP methyl ester esterase BioH [Gammaproteobacteria bacterium]